MATTTRFDSLDALRGLALVWMALFHLCFDLNHFGFWRQDFYNDPFWTSQRTCILSLFLFCAGLGQAVALHQGQSWSRFWRRWGKVAGCAVLVSAGSWLMYPQTFIYFGVLHGIALMLVVTRLTGAWGQWLWLLGTLAIAAKFLAAQMLAGSVWEGQLNGPGLNWLGLITRKPVTEDYVPVLPWLGVMWWGMAAGEWVLRTQAAMLARPIWRPLQPLAALGRWSLSFYVAHQPVMIGLLMLVATLRS